MRIENEFGSFDVEERGAYVSRMFLRGIRIFKESHDMVDTHGGMAILAPFANRIRNGEYTYDGKKYSLPKNNEGNAIHGFAKSKDFSIVNQVESAITLESVISDPGYPGKIRLAVSYSLSNNKFEVVSKATNESDIYLPYQIGFHPYFSFLDAWQISTDYPVAALRYQDKYFPDGECSLFDPFKLTSDQSTVLDTCYLSGGKIFFSTKTHRITIERENLPYFVLYNGSYSEGKSVAIEPMSAPPDCFNNGFGLKRIKPKNDVVCSFTIQIDSFNPAEK